MRNSRLIGELILTYLLFRLYPIETTSTQNPKWCDIYIVLYEERRGPRRDCPIRYREHWIYPETERLIDRSIRYDH